MTILVTAHHSYSLGVPRRWSPQGLAGWGLRLLQWVWGSGGAGDEARRALWACSELPDQNLLTGSPPGCSLPSPPSCPRTSLRMVSLYLPHCLPPSHLLCTASEQVNKCACSCRPPPPQDSLSPWGCRLDTSGSRGSLALTHRPSSAPPACTHSQAFPPGPLCPKVTPSRPISS